MRFRVGNARPLLIALGPGAANEIDVGPQDLDHFDVVILDGQPASTCDPQFTLDALVRAFLSGRFAVACLFDVRDENWWSVAASVTRLVANRDSSVRLFVCSDPRPRTANRSAMLGRLSRHLGVCVIDAPQEPGGLVRAALLPLIGLVRPGLTGFDLADLAVVLRAPSVGRVTCSVGQGLLADAGCNGILPLLREPGVTNVVVAIQCTAETTLHDISAIWTRVDDTVPAANVMLATPAGGRFEVSVLALQSTT